jgi:L-amino acid N-acyltransferase YncA
MEFTIETLRPSNWSEVRAIYLEGIATRSATFETQAPEWAQWDAAHHSFGRLVARAGEAALGWAALAPVSSRRCYAGVAEASVYVSAGHTGRGIGSALLRSLIEVSEQNGIWTLQAGIFPENAASLALVKKHGFREVGRREKLARLDGAWRDVLLLERRSQATISLKN